MAYCCCFLRFEISKLKSKMAAITEWESHGFAMIHCTEKKQQTFTFRNVFLVIVFINPYTTFQTTLG